MTVSTEAAGLLALPFVIQLSAAGQPQPGEMAGYLLVSQERVPKTYDAGFSMYVAAWPLLREYPGSRFQTGLFSTWMFAQYDGPAPENVYSDIEGGLGWWRDTRFATETPKFIMGGVALNFGEWANGPGAGKGRDWSNPRGHYGVAQLTNRLLWPPDGLNLAQGTCGELFGYGYLNLPLIPPKPTTGGRDIPTGRTHRPHLVPPRARGSLSGRASDHVLQQEGALGGGGGVVCGRPPGLWRRGSRWGLYA